MEPGQLAAEGFGRSAPGARETIKDLYEGLRARHLWWDFSWLDVKLRYQRTVLGPFWVTLGFGVSVSALGLVWSTMFKLDIREFLPYLSAGLATWMLISTLLLEGCQTFIASTSLIMQYRIPLSTHAYRLVARNLIVYMHNLVVVLGTGIILGIDYGIHTLLAFPALLLIVLNGVWACILFGLASARYRDFIQIVTVLVNVSFLVTPIFWYKDQLGSRGLIAEFNPFYHFIEIVRAPIIGQAPEPLSWIVVLGITFIGWVAMLVLASRYQHRVPYWL